MNFDILNSKPLEFFNESGELMGKIFISGSTGDLFIAPVSGTNGDVVLGDRNTVGNVEIGLPSAETTLKLMGGGLISANGQTLTIGDSTVGDSVIIGVPITASNVQTASFAISASHLIGGGGGGSSFTAQGISGSFGAPSASFSTRVTSLESGGGGGSGIFSDSNGFKVTTNNLIISKSSAGALTSSLSVQGSGSGIFDIKGATGQLFEVQDGLDGVLMSVNDISGIPILTVSSSGDVILAEGSTLQGTAATASHVPGASVAFPFAGAAVITGSLQITGSGDDIFKVTSQSGSLFSIDDGLDGILMSVNDISGLPLFEISSSELITFTGNITGSSTTTASFGHLIVNGTSISGSATGGGGSSFTAEMISGSFGAPSASFSTRVTSLEAGAGTAAGTISSSAQITSLGFVTSSATASFMTSSATGSFNNLIITNFSGSSVPGDGSTISYTVTVVDSGGDKFAIDLGGGSSTTPAFSLLAGNTYRFTQDDNSNNNHPFGFANFSDDSAYTDGVTYNGTAGQAGSYAQIVVTNSTPKLKYRCTVHGVGMGGDAAVTITTGSLVQNGFLEVSGSTRLSGSLDVLNAVTASFFKGDGSALTNLPASNPFPFNGDAVITGSLTIKGGFASFRTDENSIVLGSGSGQALQSSGVNNVILGTEAGQGIATKDQNVIIGYQAVQTGNQVDNVVAIGYRAGQAYNADSSVFIGMNAGADYRSGNSNIVIGHEAADNRETGGSENVFIGKGAAGSGLGGGDYNIALGTEAGRGLTAGTKNIFLGYNAGYGTNTGTHNIAIGDSAGSSLGGTNGNILIGHGTSVAGGTITGQLRIGSGSIATISASLETGHVILSGSTGGLELIGSGSTLFEVIGSEGTIFSLDDDLDGELFTVNDRSGIPQLLVSSSGRIEAEEGEAVIRSQRPIVTVATNPFTASADTVGKYFRVGGNITCSIFVTASAHCPIGAEFDFFQTSSVGNMLFETGSGVTLNSKNSNLNLAGQFSSATLKYIGLDEWDLMGDLT